MKSSLCFSQDVGNSVLRSTLKGKRAKIQVLKGEYYELYRRRQESLTGISQIDTKIMI